MNADAFLAELAYALQRDDSLTLDDRLKDLEEWDSLAAMGVTALLDRKFGKRLSFDDIARMQTVRDIAQAAGLDL
ncbi:MAG: acyl carrier protein [Desulfovibrionaceae bacterium]|nr:acyl carrier protein [Desulfovibrionaceae bacterium]